MTFNAMTLMVGITTAQFAGNALTAILNTFVKRVLKDQKTDDSAAGATKRLDGLEGRVGKLEDGHTEMRVSQMQHPTKDDLREMEGRIKEFIQLKIAKV